MNYLKTCLKKCDRIYVPYHEIKLLRRERKGMLANAADRFAKEKPEHGDLKDYKRALYRHRVFYGEYMHAFEFWKIDEKTNVYLSINEENKVIEIDVCRPDEELDKEINKN